MPVNTTWTPPVASGALDLANGSVMTETWVDAMVSNFGYLDLHRVKAWALADTVGGLVGSFNVASIGDTGTGHITVIFDVDFTATSLYMVSATPQSDNAYFCHVRNTNKLVGSVEVQCRDAAGTLVDPNNYFVVAFGYQ